MSTAPARGIVWDLPTRVFHWSLVLCIVLQFAGGEFGLLPMAWHYWIGYVTLALVGFRVLWGFFGSTTSRFADFVRGPRTVLAYLRSDGNAAITARAGHNPLGGWSVLAMLATVAVQAISGLFSSDDVTENGPLAARAAASTIRLMTRVRWWTRVALVALIVLHVGAVLLYGWIGRRNLVGPMLHGRSIVGSPTPPGVVSAWRAPALFALCIGVVWCVVAWGEAG
jgi:cytochrome b